jgi:hypothetical protein
MKMLDRLPITKERTSLRFGDRSISARPDQIVVWMSVHLPGVLEPEQSIPRFPALLDTGNNFGFSVQERHLRDWAGIAPGLLDLAGDIEVNGQVVALREATVWIYPNVPGRQDVAVDGRPFRLETPNGIAVYGPNADPPGPRLPLLGLPALLDSGLDCWIDPDRLHVTVQSPTWRRPLIRLLGRL